MINTQDICCGVHPQEMKLLSAVLGNIEKLVAQGGEIHFHKGQVVFYEGHHPLGFYFIKEGKVVLSRINIKGERQDFSNQQKEIYGLFHLLTHTPHCAMAMAKTDLKMIFVPKSVVLEFLQKERL